MLDVIFFVVFLIVAVRIALSVRRESSIFDEFQSPKSLAWFVLLLPLAPLVLVLLPYQTGWLPAAILAIVCCLPALLASRRCIAVFETSGTSRSDAALKSAHTAFGASLAGLIYVALSVVLIVYVSGLGQS